MEPIYCSSSAIAPSVTLRGIKTTVAGKFTDNITLFSKDLDSHLQHLRPLDLI